jgi:DNA/RNA endonuclease G (NUC1)
MDSFRVPRHFWKVVLAREDSGVNRIRAYLLENVARGQATESPKRLSVRAIEKKARLRFHDLMHDACPLEGQLSKTPDA